MRMARAAEVVKPKLIVHDEKDIHDFCSCPDYKKG